MRSPAVINLKMNIKKDARKVSMRNGSFFVINKYLFPENKWFRLPVTLSSQKEV